MSNFNINPSSGWGTAVIEVSPNGTNMNATDRRSTAHVTDGVSTKDLSIVQYGVPNAENMSGDNVYLSEGGEKEFAITTHYPIYFENIPDWIEIFDEDDGGIEEGVMYYPIDVSGHSLFFTALENEALTGRSSVITMYHELRGSEAEVYQDIALSQNAASPYASLDKDNIIFQGEDDSSDSDVVTVDTNMTFQINEVGGRFTVEVSGNTLIIRPIGQNTGSTNFVDYVHVDFYIGETLYTTITITVTQYYVNAPYIIVEPSVLYFGSLESGVSKTVTVRTNKNWSVGTATGFGRTPTGGDSADTGTTVEIYPTRNNMTANNYVSRFTFTTVGGGASYSISAVQLTTEFVTTIDNPQDYYLLYPYNNSANTLYGAYEPGPSFNLTATLPWVMTMKRSSDLSVGPYPENGSSGTTHINTKSTFATGYYNVAQNYGWNAWNTFTPAVSGVTSRKGSPFNIVNVYPPIMKNAAWTANTACPTVWFIPASGGSIDIDTNTNMVDHRFMFHNYDYRVLNNGELSDITAYDSSGNTMGLDDMIQKGTYSFEDVVSGRVRSVNTFEFGDIDDDYRSYLIEQQHVFPNGSSGYSQTRFPVYGDDGRIYNKLQIIQGGIPVQSDETFFGTDVIFPYAGAFIPFNDNVTISATSADYYIQSLSEYDGMYFSTARDTWLVDADWTSSTGRATLNGVYKWEKYRPVPDNPGWDVGLDRWPIVSIKFNTDRIIYPQSAITKQLYYSMPVYGIGNRPLSPTTMTGLLYERTLLPWPQVSISGYTDATRYRRTYVYAAPGEQFEVPFDVLSDYQIRYNVRTSGCTVIHDGVSYQSGEFDITGTSESFIVRCPAAGPLDDTVQAIIAFYPLNSNAQFGISKGIIFFHPSDIEPGGEEIHFIDPEY